MTREDLHKIEGHVRRILRGYGQNREGDEGPPSRGYPYRLDRWDEVVFAERFLYPLCHAEEARCLRGFGHVFFHRCLEYSQFVDRGESRIASDLRGAMRDLSLIGRFVEAVGTALEEGEVEPADRPLLRLAAELAPRIDALARRLEAGLPVAPERAARNEG